MSKYDYDLGIIGGGAAGLTVASGASQLGAKVILIEKEKLLGGDCLHYGCVPSKALIASAKARYSAMHQSDFGLPDLDLPPVDFSRVTGRIQAIQSAIQVHDSHERFCQLGAEVTTGDAAFTDPHTVKIDDRVITAKSWVIAAGSEPALVPCEGLTRDRVLTNEDIFSLKTLPQHLVVLGGGPIGVEMAQAFNRLGSKVTLIQRSPQLLSREDFDVAEVIQEALQMEGVDIVVGANLKSVHEDGDEKVVTYEKNGEAKSVSGSHILAALGRTPRVEPLCLSAAGVEYTRKGIPVDNKMRTNVPHIYAAGDITGLHQFTHAAGYEGGVIIANAVLKLPRKADYTWMPRCAYSDPELAGLGKCEKQLLAAGLVKGTDYSVWTEYFSENDRALSEGKTQGMVKLLLDKKEKPLGVQIVGHGAGDLAAHWGLAFTSKLGLSSIASVIHPYPTYGEINKRVAGSVLSGKLFSEKVKKVLHFLFQYRGAACTPGDLTDD
ncbi:MAG: dihydrolipoyl dehydrogenase family protein [Desulfovibrio sp.]